MFIAVPFTTSVYNFNLQQLALKLKKENTRGFKKLIKTNFRASRKFCERFKLLPLWPRVPHSGCKNCGVYTLNPPHPSIEVKCFGVEIAPSMSALSILFKK